MTRTGWWLVPLRYDRLVAWYSAHTQARVGSAYLTGAKNPVRAGTLDWRTHDKSPAYSPPAEVVTYQRLRPHLTALRADVTLAARADRTMKTLVPATVTSIDITKKAIDGPDTSPKTVTLTDPALMLAVVASFDSASGYFSTIGPQGCGSPVGIVYTYAVTFHWPTHTLAADPGEPFCGVGRGLTLDGLRLPQTLQDDTKLNNALSAAFDGP